VLTGQKSLGYWGDKNVILPVIFISHFNCSDYPADVKVWSALAVYLEFTEVQRSLAARFLKPHYSAVYEKGADHVLSLKASLGHVGTSLSVHRDGEGVQPVSNCNVTVARDEGLGPARYYRIRPSTQLHVCDL
jgi:hypothetical protein